MLLTGKARRDFLRYIYHTEEGRCHHKYNISIEESGLESFNNLINKDFILKNWLYKNTGLKINNNSDVLKANEIYNTTH